MCAAELTPQCGCVARVAGCVPNDLPSCVAPGGCLARLTHPGAEELYPEDGPKQLFFPLRFHEPVPEPLVSEYPEVRGVFAVPTEMVGYLQSESGRSNHEEDKEKLRVVFEKHKGSYISSGGDLLVATLTLEQARKQAATLENCRGFCFKGREADGPMKIYFKDHSRVYAEGDWTSYLRRSTWVKQKITTEGLVEKVRSARLGSKLLRLGFTPTPSEASTTPSATPTISRNSSENASERSSVASTNLIEGETCVTPISNVSEQVPEETHRSPISRSQWSHEGGRPGLRRGSGTRLLSEF